MPTVAVESILNWYWLVDWLPEAGLEVKLAHSLGLFMITVSRGRCVCRWVAVKQTL